MTVVPLEYIEVDDRGVAKLIGSRIKVRFLAAYARAGWSVDQLHRSYPHLGLDQIHAALAYYFAHREVVDAEIEEASRYADEMRAKHPNTLTREGLEARWRALHPDRQPPTLAEIEADIADLL